MKRIIEFLQRHTGCPMEGKMKWFYCLSWIFLIVGFFMMLRLLYLIYQPFREMEVKRFETIKTEYKRGEILDILVDYCKYENVRADIYPEFSNDIVFYLHNYFSNFPVGCHVIIMKQQFIPLELPVGTYRFKVTSKVPVNQYKMVIKEFATNEFKVIN